VGMTKESPLTARDISGALLARHAPPEWATFEELRNATGFGHSRTIDVAAFNTWKSSGYIRVAYEVKISRGDFMRELDNWDKHRWVEESFHETYFAAPAKLIDKAEVPEGWGLLEVRRQKNGVVCKRAVRARRRDVRDLPQLLMLSILRRAAGQVATIRSRTFRVDGAELDADGLQQLVDRRVSDSLKSNRESLEYLQRKAGDEYKRAQGLSAPLDRLASLARWHGSRWEATRDDVDTLVAAAAAKKLERWLSEVRSASRSLAALESLCEQVREEERRPYAAGGGHG